MLPSGPRGEGYMQRLPAPGEVICPRSDQPVVASQDQVERLRRL
jgi:hypothetical protein